MGDTVKSLFFGSIPSTGFTTVYTVPTNKQTVVRSIIITSAHAQDKTFDLMIGSIYLVAGHKIKAGDTFAIKDLDIPLSAGDTIVVYCTGSVNAIISGFERDYADFGYPLNYPYIKAIGNLTTSTSSLVPLNANDTFVVKGIFLTNVSGTDATATIIINGMYVIINKAIKAYDALLVTLPDIVIPAPAAISGQSTVHNVIRYGIILMKAVQ